MTQADEQAALLSLHFYEAGDNDRAWRYAVLAGERAEASFANVVAAELFERALAAAEHLDDVRDAESARVSTRRSATSASASPPTSGRRAPTRGARDSSPTTRSSTRGCSASRRHVLERSGRYDDALEAYERGPRPARRTSTGRTPTRLGRAISIGQAGIRYRADALRGGDRWLRAAASSTPSAAERPQHASRTRTTSSTRRYTDLGTPDGLPYLELALPIYEELGDFRGQGVVLNNLGIHAYYEGRWDESLEYYRREPRRRRSASAT